MIDESTDIANLNLLITYIRIYYKGQILTNFLDIRQLDSQRQTAENLEKVFKQICEDYGLKLDNLVGICTDGAASMDGNRSGMVTRLKQRYPGLQSFHCCAHRWHLAAEDTIKYNELNQLKKAENVLLQIWHTFSISPKNTALLTEMHTLDQTEQMSIKKLCIIRWLSCFQSVKAAKHELIAIWKTLDILILQKNASALGLLSLTTKKKFITSLYITEPVLELLSNTSKQMQKADLSFDQIEPSVLGCISRLKALKDSNTIEQNIINEWKLYQQKAKNSIEVEMNKTISFGSPKFTFPNMSQQDKIKTAAGKLPYQLLITDLSTKDLEQISKCKTTYISLTIQSLQQRFQEVPLITSLSIFNPNCSPSTIETLFGYGNDHIANLIEAFWSQIRMNIQMKEINKMKQEREVIINEIESIKKDKSKQVQEFNQVMINKDKLIKEKENEIKKEILKIAIQQWEGYRNNLPKNFKRKSQRDVCIRTIEDQAFGRYFIIQALAQIALTLPLINASTKMGFSQLKLIKRRERNKLQSQTLQALMNICINGKNQLTNNQLEYIYNEWMKTLRRAISAKDIYINDEQLDDTDNIDIGIEQFEVDFNQDSGFIYE